MYSLNVLFITIFQNTLWDYVAVRPEYLKEDATEKIVRNYRIACNVAMVNALIAIVLSFISPITAFIILFSRLPMILLANQYFKRPRGSKVKS
jgi:hypothetical protein